MTFSEQTWWTPGEVKGLLMALDVPEERGGAELDLRWGDPRRCHFPLLPHLGPLPLPYMATVYALMFIGALGVMLGYKFRRSAALFAVTYWYVFLVEKSFWNNHSYLFGLIAILLVGTGANQYLSIDAYLNPQIKNKPVPYWNYFILKYQLFILYFVAGLKKCSAEWLSGYAMSNLSQHWVFNPITMFMSVELTDFLIVHWFAFVFDLTIFFWMTWPPTRRPAMLLCAAFHLMNSRLFTIGMFPWVCLATMPLFCAFDWPTQISAILQENIKNIYFQLKCLMKFRQTEATAHIAEENELAIENVKNDLECSPKDECHCTKTKQISNRTIVEVKSLKASKSDDTESKVNKDNGKCRTTGGQRCVVGLLFTYAALQAFLPYSHFITKGYNNWTNGLYGYSWDMMVNSWDTILIVVKITDNEKRKAFYLNPEAWVPNDRWSKHGDMIHQYSRCISRNIKMDLNQKSQKTCDFNPTTNIKNRKNYYKLYEPLDYVKQKNQAINPNISIYIDVWCSMNGRFQQRMFNPTIDLLASSWSPFEPVPWLMPLMTTYTDWRRRLLDIQDHVFSWNNYTDVLFVADFPGMFLENYISADLQNVTITVLDGQVDFEDEHSTTSASTPESSAKRFRLRKGQSRRIAPGMFHKVHTAGSRPACYMFTYLNATRQADDAKADNPSRESTIKKGASNKRNGLKHRVQNLYTFLKLVVDSLMYVFFRLPVHIRVRI